MPGIKRHRDGALADGAESEEEDEVISVESALSELRQDNRKKPRLSDECYEDEDSDVSNDDDSENLQETQFHEKQRRKARVGNQPADNGVIESVTCTNFMCHSFLEVTIGPLINFVIGHNGSGKSAVLTAITICLGGKATSTNRGGSLKAFIKEGQESCILNVRLKNGGETGYQQDVYGDSIMVERHFTRNGTSGFKLRSSTGKIISTRKADLEDISDYYSLQIDNPMTVLTQDMARQFLSNSTSHEKYKFFIKGVQLEQLSQDYRLLEENIDYIETTFGEKKAAIDDLESAAKQAKELFVMSEKHDNMRQKISRMSMQMAWIQVEEQERDLDSLDQQLRKAVETIAQTEYKVLKLSEQFQESHEAHGLVQQQVEALQADCEPIRAEKEKTKETYNNIKGEARVVQAEQRKIKESLHNEEKRIAKLENDIREEFRRLEEANGGSHAKRLEEIDARKDDVQEAKARLEEHNQDLHSLEGTKDNASQACERLRGPRRSKDDEVQRCQADLHNLMQDHGQQRAGYPANMTQLINAVRQDKSFIQIPVGPVGDYVRLLKPVWSGILEKSFGSTLNSFIVTNKQDQMKLSFIMQRVRCQCPITIGNNNTFDFSKNEPDSDLDTALRVLEIDDLMVQRQLIINQAIEQTILIEDPTEARQRMDSNRLRNVKQCFSINKKGGTRLVYGWQGGLNSTFTETYRGIPRMKTDLEMQIRLKREALEQAERERKEIDSHYLELQKAENDSNKVIAKHHKRTKELKLEIERAESVVYELQDAIDKDAIQEGKLDALKKSLTETQNEKTISEGSYGESVTTRDKHLADMNKLRQQLESIDERLKEAESKVKKAESKLLKAASQRQLALQDKNSVIEVLQAAKVDRTQLEQDRAAKVEQVANYTGQASQVGPRVTIESGETGSSLEKKLNALVKDLERYEKKLGGNKKKILEDLVRATQAYNNALFHFREEEKLAQLLKSSLIHRQFRWRQFKKYITARAKLMFQYLLSTRGYRGKLSLDHKSRALELNVQPDETEMSRGRKTKTLSGGEKSFSTICLLLALWEAMGAPVRCLDEFDVFMDSVNRDISMKMLISAARNSVSRQFIFITPQSMGDVDRELDVKIIKMRDPERNQATLAFSRS